LFSGARNLKGKSELVSLIRRNKHEREALNLHARNIMLRGRLN
jgi:hypothetical protein